jgi:PucR-like helix-turn-helix protein/diguanylate cyclase with GGDEF domain
MDIEAAAPAGGRHERPAEEGELALLLGRLAQQTGAPVVLQDDQLRVLAAAGGERAALDAAHCHVTRQLTKRVAAVQRPARLDVGYRPTRLVVPVVVGGDLLGFLTAEHSNPDDAELGKRLERAALEIGLEMAVELRVQAILDDDEHDFFNDLLEGRTPHRMMRRGFKLGYDVRVEHTPLAVAVETDAEALEPIVRALARDDRPPHAIIGRDDDAVVAFLPTTDSAIAFALARSILDQSRQQGLTAAAATGPVCVDVGDFPRAADKAKWAARMRLVTGNTDLVSSFDDLGVAALLFQVDDHTDLEQFVDRWIGPVVAYDADHGTHLTETLRVLLETRSLRATSEALFVHKSTLKYRIKRINELLESDYQDSETFFNLQVALRVHQMVRGLR